MARIRSIKPSFFKHAALYDAEKATGLPLRLAFAGLWTVADREGRFKWRPREIKIDVLPYDDIDFSAVMDALATHNFILKYRCAGDVFGYIPKFAEHQHVNPREAPSVIASPADADPDADASRTRKPRVKHATATRLREELTAGVLTSGSLDHREQEGEGKEDARARVISEPLPDWIPLQAWNDFLEMRRKLRAPLTDKAIQLAIVDLEKLRDAGHEPSAVLEQSTMRSWRGLFAISETSNGRAQQQGRGIRDGVEHALAAVRRASEDDAEGHRPGSQQRQALTGQKSTGAHHPGDGGADHPGDGGSGRGFPKLCHDNRGTEPAISDILRRSGAPVGAAGFDRVQALPHESREQILPDARDVVGVGKVIQ